LTKRQRHFAAGIFGFEETGREKKTKGIFNQRWNLILRQSEGGGTLERKL
jgi:hypothetical protein